MLFPRQLPVGHVLASLQQQLRVKGLHYYLLKLVGDKYKYEHITPGHSIGQLFDQYAQRDYLQIIYHTRDLGKKKITPLNKRIRRLAILVTVVWACVYSWPYIEKYLGLQPSESQGDDILL